MNRKKTTRGSLRFRDVLTKVPIRSASRLLGVQVSDLHRIAEGLVQPGLPVRARICHEFDIPLSWWDQLPSGRKSKSHVVYLQARKGSSPQRELWAKMLTMGKSIPAMADAMGLPYFTTYNLVAREWDSPEASTRKTIQEKTGIDPFSWPKKRSGVK